MRRTFDLLQIFLAPKVIQGVRNQFLVLLFGNLDGPYTGASNRFRLISGFDGRPGGPEHGSDRRGNFDVLPRRRFNEEISLSPAYTYMGMLQRFGGKKFFIENGFPVQLWCDAWKDNFRVG